MGEAKYKVGDEVVYGSAKAVVKTVGIVQVEIPNGALMYAHEDRLTPYVSPLAVGDRVRTCASGCQGVIIATHKSECWVDRGERYGCVTYHVDELERIPTEAGK